MIQLIKPAAYIVFFTGFFFIACKKEVAPPVQSSSHPKQIDTVFYFTVNNPNAAPFDPFDEWTITKKFHVPVLDSINTTNLRVFYKFFRDYPYVQLKQNGSEDKYWRIGPDITVFLYILGAPHVSVFVRITT